jgi:PKD repeat protein
MANKDFGVKRIELIGSSGTPNLTSPTNLNLNANTVAISTDVTIGGKVQSDVIVGAGYSVGIGSTQPQQALDVTGDIIVTGGISTNGIGTAVSLNIVGNDLIITVGSLSTTFALS